VLKTRRILEETGIRPDANQIEINPYFPQYDLVDFCKENWIQVIAHCPLGGALAPSVANRKGAGPLEDPQVEHYSGRLADVQYMRVSWKADC
jgi:alcohol dehydrogenase (NADP+)